MMIDSHCHGEFSFDSGTSLEALLEEAKKKNMGLILTEHMDLHQYKGDRFVFDPQEYFSALGKFRDQGVGLGIELGLRHEAKEYYEKISREYAFDFLLGSTHAPYRSYDDLEFTYRKLHEHLSVEACYRYFWENVLQGLEENPYLHAFSHVDYVARYHPDLYGGHIPFEAIQDLMEKAFKLMVDLEIDLEINTARLGNPLGRKQWKRILELYRGQGGAYVTLGSDAHKQDHLGRHFDIGQSLAHEQGLKPVYYREKKRTLL